MPLSTTPPRLPPRAERTDRPAIGSSLTNGFGADPFSPRMHVTAGGEHTLLGMVAEIYMFCRERLKREAPDALKEMDSL